MNKGVGTGNSRHARREVWTPPPKHPPPPPPSENSIVVLVQKEDPLQVLL